ncbi:tail fiber protein, partial [Salmonella enterica]|nr:tail fiber protein [Salmonella enterica]
MGKLTETTQWEDDIYQLETSDPVLGGPDGVSNKPQKQLANRTQWLKQQLETTNSALANHAKSRNHPDASLTAKGFVQLYSGVMSDSEILAATPKAVKIAMDNANARLAKDQNLADLTNVPLARQSLQLGNSATLNTGTATGTVAAGDDSRITGAMQKSQNGADVPDKPAFLQNVGAFPVTGGR